MKEFKVGLKDGLPIALGYLAVSFSMGIFLISSGLTSIQGAIMSITNVTSAGQFAGIKIIAAGGTLLEMGLTQFIINLRYALMSLSLSQKIDESVKLWQRFVIAFANTDEIFAVAINHGKSVTFKYMLGLESIPILGWTLGTVLGAVASNLLPESVSVAMNVMLYGMFIAIVVPQAKKSRPVLYVALIAIFLSCCFKYISFLSFISEGISIIICTLLAAVIGAIFWPNNET